MMSFLLETAVLPLRAIALAARHLFPEALEAIHRAIWRITGSPMDAAGYFRHRYGHDPAAARKQVERLLADSSSARLHVELCLLDYRIMRDAGTVRGWLETARARGCAEPHQLLYVDMLIADSPDEIERAAAAILGRNDLPSHFTRLALDNMTLLSVGLGRWAEAEETADRVLAVEEDRWARTFKLAFALRGGRDDIGTHERLLKSGNPDQCHASMALAWFYAGNPSECRSHLSRCSEVYLEHGAFETGMKEIADDVLRERRHAQPK